MDVFIQNMPDHVNHVESRLFLRGILEKFGILAYDVFKKPGNNWAILTVANPENGRRFVACYGNQGRQQYGSQHKQSLLFQSRLLNCKTSNKKGQPEALKVISLLQKEEEMKAKRNDQSYVTQPTPSARSTFPFQSLMTGVWEYDHHNKLIFDKKFKDRRQGCVTFGKSALVVYLRIAVHHEINWHGRIDIPYGILEHAIPSAENGTNGAITFTLKSPPKIYMINEETDNLRLYAGEQATATPNELPNLAGLSVVPQPQKDRRGPRLERLCSLHRQFDKNSALCMVYKLSFSNMSLVHKAWTFLQDFSVPKVHCWKTMVPGTLTATIESDLADLELAIADTPLIFAEKFQLLALVLEGTISPTKAKSLILHICSLSQKNGAELTALAIRKLGHQIPTPGPHVSSKEFHVATMVQTLEDNVGAAQSAEMTYNTLHSVRKPQEHLALTYKATVTPTGMILRGPDWNVSNRVLRKYSRHAEYFMRVFFADEDGLSVFHDSRASQEEVYDRFKGVLNEGIFIAGRHYEFLGFSHASLRCHQAWFMAPFLDDGKTINARDVIRDLGDFSNIHCSAKCAARIGQAFSDTIFAVPIPSTAWVTETKDDVERNNRCFSDGCGTMSLALFERVWRALPRERKQQRPTILQIRYRGAKGVLSLDTSLNGEQLHIRNSMTKYIATEGRKYVEICQASYKSLKMFLNHQFIKILEDLGVPKENFIAVQNEASRTLELVIQHPLNAASFLDYSHSGVHARIPRLFKLMHYIGINFQADRFLTDIVEIAAMANLRSLKYRARIPIEQGYLLYGIMDETNILREGEVYITTQNQRDDGSMRRSTLIRDRVVVMRAPALHPGDVQLVRTVDVPGDSPLKDLANCIVFSQQGARDLPSQLSGGDLDGDLFHVIYDPRLIPGITYPPADYDAAAPKDLGRSVEVTDITDFFIQFMKMDRLGQISNMHKIRADLKPLGTKDDDCLVLAELASDAVDFSKSGEPADMTKVPRGSDHFRPDFMAPGHTMVLNELGATELADLEKDDIDDPDSLSILDPDKSKIRYYRSNKVLGHLYRNIDEKSFFDRMKNKFEAQRTWGSESLIQQLERYIDRETVSVQWAHHRRFAEDLREYYENNMIDIMDSLRAHRGKPLTELEVFSGNILGKKERASTRYIREANQEVQERFNRDVSAIVKNIVYGDGDLEENESEALPRALACWKVALETEAWENQVPLRSCKYVAASVCLEQLWKFQNGRLRPL